METITKTEPGAADSKNNGGEGAEEMMSLSKKEFETLNQTLGSLKKQVKDFKKASETSKDDDGEIPTKNQSSNETRLAEKAFLRSAGITAAKEVELALATAKKWGVSIDDLVDDGDFQDKLEKLRTQTSNELATSQINKGGTGTSQAKSTPEYWIAKGTPPSAADVPDRKLRAKIARAMMANAKGTGKTFYND